MIRKICGFMLAAGMVVSSGSIAMAADKPITGNISKLKYGDIPCSTASFELKKPVHDDFAGIPIEELPEGLISGVTYKAELLDGIDLNTLEGWNKVEGLTVEAAKSIDVGAIYRAKTNKEGRALFSNLPVGAYLVSEETAENVPEGYHASDPFLLTAPIGTAKSEMWLCNFFMIIKELPDLPPLPDRPIQPPTAAPPAPAAPENPKKPGINGLVNTGASVIGIAVIALGLSVLGVVLIRRKKR